MVSFFSRDSIKKLNNNWIFNYIVALLFILSGILGWYYEYSYTGMIALSLLIILLFIFNDFKYFVPAITVLIFSYNGGFSTSSFPVDLVGYIVVLVIIMILFIIINIKKISFKKKKSIYGIFLLAIITIIPIFWNNTITDSNKVLYLMYFSWLLYFLVYFVLNAMSNKNTLRMVIFTFSILPLLIGFECFIRVIDLHRIMPEESILQLSYTLGWGICNEAGIMLIFCLPFIFYEVIKSDNSIINAFGIMKIAFTIVGIIITGSRGSILFGSILMVPLVILLVIFSKKRITNISFLVMFLILGVLFLELKHGIFNAINDVVNFVFSSRLRDPEREKLYLNAINLWKENGINMFFGSGIISELDYHFSYYDYDTVYIVYHSTFFEMLVIGGILGIIALGVHFFEKYRQLKGKDKIFGLVFLFGYLLIDLYGMIDNTYGMFYYMVPLIMLMAALDNSDKNINLYTNNICLEGGING